MNNLKSLLVIGVLGVVAYGVYAMLIGQPDRETAQSEADPWDVAPNVELPDDEPGDSRRPILSTDRSDNLPLVQLPENDSPPLAETRRARPDRRERAMPADERGMDEGGIMRSAYNSPRLPGDDSFAGPLPPETAADHAGPFVGADAHREFAGTLSDARLMIDEGRLVESLESLSYWYHHDDLTPQEDRQLMELLDPLAGEVIYSQAHLLERPYEVQPGDSLDRVADAYAVSWQLLAKINGIDDPRHIRQGDLLKVIRGPFNAVVDLTDYTLTLSLRGLYAGRFAIGIGQDQSTPDGTFDVRNKVTNPTYYGRDGVVDANDPSNPLGEHWIDLGNHLGIHGTNDPSTIGRDDSKGCIRLGPQEAEDVFDILTIGSTVVIRRQ